MEGRTKSNHPRTDGSVERADGRVVFPVIGAKHKKQPLPDIRLTVDGA